jgi:hypothetical protein
MSTKWNSSPVGTSAVTADDLVAATEVDNDWLTVDEMLHAPINMVDAEMEARGWADYEVDEARLGRALQQAQLPLGNVLEASLAPPPAIDRPELVASLFDEISAHCHVVILGAHGSGKSHLMTRLLSEQNVRQRFPRVIRLDCAALRMGCPILFGREAVWAHFGADDDGFKRFITDIPDEKEMTALTALVAKRLRNGGLVVFDHAEKLSPSKEIDGWLTDQFFPHADALGVRILFAHAAPVQQLRPALRATRTWSLPDISQTEIASWLDGPQMRRLWAAGLSARSLANFTGGRPPLLRDFGTFVHHSRHIGGGRVLREFVRWRSRDHQFLSDCERLVRVARRHPEVIGRALMPEAFATRWTDKDLPADALPALLATGALRRDQAGNLKVASPIYARRLLRLVRPDALSVLAINSDFHQIDSTSAWKILRRHGELASDALAKSLDYESSPAMALQGLVMFLLRWELRAKIYVRDQDISKLWSPFDRPDQIGPLEGRKQPDFAQAAQTGQVVTADDGRTFVPIISHTGTATMVVVLESVKSQSRMPCTRQIDFDRVAGVLEGIQPTLAQLVQRMALRRDRKFRGKLWYKSKMPEPLSGRDGLLKEVGCQSVVVFEKQHNANWAVSRFQRTGDRDDGLRWTESFAAIRLEAIVRHRSRHGLVLSGDHATEAFPRLTGRDVSLYLYPVTGDGKSAIVAFLFEGGSSGLDGYLQKRLSVFAPDVLKAA